MHKKGAMNTRRAIIQEIIKEKVTFRVYLQSRSP
jgi:hypothetical protein